MDFFNKGLDVCAVSKDIDRKIVNCNQKFLDFLGKTKEEVMISSRNVISFTISKNSLNIINKDLNE